MADSRLTYQLTSAESMRWQQGGEAALMLQHQLAEIHHQGSLGLAPLLDVLYPDGMLAAQYTPSGQGPAAQRTGPAQVSVEEPSQSSSRLEGTLFRTSTVTAYQMSAEESTAWARGNQDTRNVTATVATGLREAAGSRAVPVLLNDGRWAYTHGSNPLQIMAEEFRHWHPLQGFAAQMGQLRERLSDLSSGVQVQFSMQLGNPSATVQASLKTLEQRVDQLTSWRESLGTNGPTRLTSEVSEPVTASSFERLHKRVEALQTTNGHQQSPQRAQGMNM